MKRYDHIITIGIFHIRIPLSGGKAGKGHAKTSNVQVFDSKRSSIVKLFPFKTKDGLSRITATQKAQKYATDLSPLNQTIISI